MAEIRIEANTVEAWGISTFADHLYLVLVADDGSESVIRGGPTGNGFFFNYGEIGMEIGMPMANSVDNRPVADRDVYGSRVLDLDGRDASAVWGAMLAAAREIDDAPIGYGIFDRNSNSAVAAALRDVGLDVDDWLPTIDGIRYFAGKQNALTADYAREVLLSDSSPGADWLRGGALDDRFETGGGADQVAGEGGRDRIDGGAGFDTCYFGTENGVGVTLSLGPGRGVGGEADGDVYRAVEAFVGTDASDIFRTNAGAFAVAAGGAGKDTFRLHKPDAGGTPGATLAFGGADRDTFVLTDPGTVAAVRLTGLAEGTMHALDVAALAAAIGTALASFDLLLLNPDADDRLRVAGDAMRVDRAGLTEFDLTALDLGFAGASTAFYDALG